MNALATEPIRREGTYGMDLLDRVKVKALREGKGWTQQQAAEAAELGGRGRWNDIEAGRGGSVTLATLAKIASALGVEPAELLVKPPPPAAGKSKGKGR